MILPFRIEIEHGQLHVFSLDDVAPCNDWTAEYIAQGFCWMETQIAFLALIEKGVCAITVELADEVQLRPDAIRAIQLPIEVREDSETAICSYPYTTSFDVPAGHYRLTFQAGLKHIEDWWTEMWCVFSFTPCENAEPKILRQDERLNPPTPLYTAQDCPLPLVRLTPEVWQ